MSILSCVFLFALDNTIVADVQPAIVNEFHDVAMLPWLSVAFLLGAASTLLVWSVNISSMNHQKLAHLPCVGPKDMASLIASGFTLSPPVSSKLDPLYVVLPQV